MHFLPFPQVLSHRAVQNTLSIMHMNGMYGFSGEWMFDIGLPAKSSSSGLILVVVPGKTSRKIYILICLKTMIWLNYENQNFRKRLFIFYLGVLGMCLWSPCLDQSKNSARGVEFTRLLTQTFALQDNHTMSPNSKFNIINRSLSSHFLIRVLIR